MYWILFGGKDHWLLEMNVFNHWWWRHMNMPTIKVSYSFVCSTFFGALLQGFCYRNVNDSLIKVIQGDLRILLPGITCIWSDLKMMHYKSVACAYWQCRTCALNFLWCHQPRGPFLSPSCFNERICRATKHWEHWCFPCFRGACIFLFFGNLHCCFCVIFDKVHSGLFMAVFSRTNS